METSPGISSCSFISTTLVEIFSPVFSASNALNVIVVSWIGVSLSNGLTERPYDHKKAHLKRVLSFMEVLAGFRGVKLGGGPYGMLDMTS